VQGLTAQSFQISTKVINSTKVSITDKALHVRLLHVIGIIIY